MPVPLVFLGGLGRSGSTLLERLLGQLPGAVAVGESVHLWQRALLDDELCGCGRPFRQCPFWQSVGTEAFGGWENVDPHRVLELQARVDRFRHIPRHVLHDSSFTTSVDEYVSYYSRLYAAVRAVSGCRVVVDSSKHTSLAYCLRRSGDVDLRVLHVVRDSRAVAHSWARVVVRPEARHEDYMTRYSPGTVALLWNAHNILLSVLRQVGTPVERVSYERLLTDPPGQLARLSAFAGLPADAFRAFVTESEVVLEPSHSVAGNPMRFDTGRVPLRRDEAWRLRMSARDRRVVTLLTAPLLWRYGYLPQ